ncbi:MAG TPA: response regulator [Bacteroidia bacterium]|jgi:CheY-like chemotaxis protein|nr:response regulator [Bacteroidia bacterium]
MKYSNILLIDDDGDDQEFFENALRIVSETAAFEGMESAVAALKKLETKEIVPEVIFLDWNMPVMNGHEFLEAIKQKEGLKDIPVIIISTSSHYKTITLSRELGAVDFITKPNNFGDLVEILGSFVKR